MKYIKFILATSLAFGSFSIHAEKKQDLTKKILTNAGYALKTTGRVAKTGGYGLLTGVSGITTLLPVGLLVALGYARFNGFNRIGIYNERDRDQYGRGDSSREIGITVDDKIKDRELGLDGSIIMSIAMLAFASMFVSSTYGMGKLTAYFARKTKQAAQEIKGTQNSKS